MVRRLAYYTSLPYAGTTSQTPSGIFNQGYGCSYGSGCSGNYGTPGLITIPWTEYVYGSGGVPNTITTFAQTAWTFDIQFYSLGSTGGNIFEAVDASNNQLVLVNWNAGNGNVTVTAGGASPIVVGTISPNTYNALAITKNGTAFSFCLNGGTVFTTTATIASIANLEWLDNTGSGNLAQQANLTTIDVYASQSVITGTAAVASSLNVSEQSDVHLSSDFELGCPVKTLSVLLLLLIASVLPSAAQIGPSAGSGDGVSLVENSGGPTSPVTIKLGFVQNGTFAPMQGGVSAYGQNAITVGWQTSLPCASQINYGLTTTYGQTVTDSALISQHSLTMTGLGTGTDVHYNVVCVNAGVQHGQSGDQVVSTQGTTTLSQLVYPGGHVGQATDNTFGGNYATAGPIADAIIQGEFTSTTADNDCKWAFTASTNGTIGELASCYYVLFTRFHNLTSRFTNLLWQTGSENPSGMSFTSATWQGNIANFRVPQMVAEFGNFSQFFSIDANNEPWVATPCYLVAGVYLNVGGCNSWYYPFQALGPYVSSTTRLVTNQYSFGEHSSRWGGDYPGPNAYINQNDVETFQGGIERIQEAIIAGVRIDGVGYETHLSPSYIYSSNDLKYQLYDVRRLGLVPEITEGTVSMNCGNGSSGCSTNSCPVCTPGSSLVNQQYASQYMATVLDTFIRYGGVKDITFWTSNPEHVGSLDMALYLGNQKTPLYNTFSSQLQNISPAVTFPRVRRINFVFGPPTPPTITSQTYLTADQRCELWLLRRYAGIDYYPMVGIRLSD